MSVAATPVVARRPPTIRDADRIAVVSGGGIAEVGTHAALLARGGAYARLHAAQRLDEGGVPEAAE